MRFLFGIIAGAAVTLLLAQAAGTVDRDWLQRVPMLFDELAVAAGELLQLPPRPPPANAAPVADPPEQVVTPAQPDVLPALAGEPVGGPAGERAAEPAAKPIPRPPDPRPMDAEGEDVQRIVAEVFEQPPLAAEQGRQTVWVPFHSEMSASGFAHRLTESLDHPFLVERRGPARYQVVFSYRDEPQRRALLSEAKAVTGLPL